MLNNVINVFCIILSVIIVQVYRTLMNKRYGKLPTISHSAKPLKKEGLGILFHTFIVIGIFFLLSWVAQNLWCTIGGIVISGIGIITGYNPNIEVKLQNILHVSFVFVSVACYLVGIYFLNWWYLIIVAPFAVYCIVIFIKRNKIRGHTRIIEYSIIYSIQLVLAVHTVYLFFK